MVTEILVKESLSEQIDRKSTRLNSSHITISYAVFCLKKKKRHKRRIPRPVSSTAAGYADTQSSCRGVRFATCSATREGREPVLPSLSRCIYRRIARTY